MFKIWSHKTGKKIIKSIKILWTLHWTVSCTEAKFFIIVLREDRSRDNQCWSWTPSLLGQHKVREREREIVHCRPLQWLHSPVDSNLLVWTRLGQARLVMMKPGSISWYSIHLIDILSCVIPPACLLTVSMLCKIDLHNLAADPLLIKIDCWSAIVTCHKERSDVGQLFLYPSHLPPCQQESDNIRSL